MILDEYASFLSERGIPFYTKDGFSVKMDSTMINVDISPDNTVTLSGYIGLVNKGIRAAKRLTSALLDRFPSYKIWPEMYSGYYEIEVERSFQPSTVEALHEKVQQMATMIERGFEIGKDMLGEDFVR